MLSACSVLTFLGMAIDAYGASFPSRVGGADIPVARGFVTGSSSLSQGVYEMPLTGEWSPKVLSFSVNAIDGGAEVDGVFYAVRHSVYVEGNVYIDKWDPVNWIKLNTVGQLVSTRFRATDVTLDPVSGLVYGCFLNDDGNGYEFGTVDYVNESRPAIAVTDKLNGIAAAQDGTLYAIDNDGTLVTIDKATGGMTPVGPTGLHPDAPGSAAIYPRTGRMYWAVTSGGESGIYEIDLSDGAATRLVSADDAMTVTALHFAPPEAADDAPGAVSGLMADFPQGALSGNVTFTTPAQTFAGDEGSGPLAYSVLLNGEEKATGNAAWNTQVNVPVTVEKPGRYEVVVTMSNEAGASPKQKVALYIGSATPAAPTPTATYDASGMVAISWDAVTTAVGNGYFDPADITYRVVRMPDGVTIAEATSDLSLTDTFDPETAFTLISYEVTACNKGVISEKGTTPRLSVGIIYPPYLNDFSGDGPLDGYVVTGSPAWTPRSGAIFIGMTFTSPLDSWAITPPVKLLPGREYSISVDLRSYSDDYPEKAGIMMGLSPTPEGMTIPVLETTTIQSGTYATYSRVVTVDTEGLYYIGLHGCSDAYNFNLYADNLQISEGKLVQSPGEVTDFEVTPGEKGAKKAILSFTTPKIDFEGDPITSLSKIVLERTDGLDEEMSTSVIKVYDSPAVDTPLEHVDEEVALGYHTYRVTSYNAAGPGRAVEKRVYVGINRPQAPANVTLVETANEGEVTMSWDAPTTDVDGLPIDAEFITYDIAADNGAGELVFFKEGLTETTVTFRALEDGVGDLVEYYLTATTESGSSEVAKSPMVAVGAASQLPYRESFAAGGLSNPMGFRILTGIARWYVTHESLVYDFNASDGDRGFAYMLSTTPGHSAELFTGKISLSGIEEPVLLFDTYNIAWDNPDTNNLEVWVTTGGDTDKVSSVTMEHLPNEEWNRVGIDLGQYSGKTVTLSFVGIHGCYYNTLLDNIVIDRLPQLPAVDGLSGLGDDAKVTLTWNEPVIGNEFPVFGHGVAKFSGYNVYRDGEKINDTPVSGTFYDDIDAPTTAASYTVTALYGEKESAHSNEVFVSRSGLESTSIPAVKVTAGNGCITIHGAKDKAITISNVAGMSVDYFIGEAVSRVTVAPGIYLVTVDGTTCKIVVR